MRMGRKSNKKKIVRELVKEKALKVEEKKQPKKVKKSSKKASKTLKKISAKLKHHKTKIFSSAFVIIMLAILLSVGYLLLQKAFRADPIAKFLPADKTIATVEINSNLDHQQLKRAFKLMEKYPEYSEAKLIAQIDTYFQLNYETDLKLWLGRGVGLALLNNKNDDDVNPVYFAEVLSRTNINKFLSKFNPAENEYNGSKTYLIEGPYYLTFIDDYLFVTQNEETIYQLIDGQDSPSLYTSEQYRKINNNLPLNRVAFVYLNFESVSDAVFKHYTFLGENGLSMEVISPLLKIFKAEGISFIALEDNFAVQSFLSLSDKVANNSDYLSFQSKYNANLLNFVPNDALFFWGGEDLNHQLRRFVELLSGGEEGALAVFDTVIQSYSSKYLGPNMNFNDDILPLFANEFSFVYENGGHYKLLLELNDAQQDAVKIHEIAGSFAELGAVFEPKVVEHELKDGTIGREIVAVPKEITKSDKKYNEYTIFELNMGEENKGLFYAIVDKIALLSDNEDSLKRSLDLLNDSSQSLRNTPVFISQIEPVMKSSDEVSYFNAPGLLPLFFGDKEMPKFLNTISSLSSGRNYFNDGVVTINYLHID